jgi:hypothetical protein
VKDKLDLAVTWAITLILTLVALCLLALLAYAVYWLVVSLAIEFGHCVAGM